MREQLHGGGLHIHADAGDAALHHARKRRFQLRLLEVVLILAHADRLGIDLHQLGERVLHAPGDGHRAAQGHVVLREFLRRQLAGRVDARARLADDHVLDARQLGQKRGDELLALARGRAVADGNRRDLMPARHGEDQLLGRGLLPLLPGEGEMAHAGLQHLARLIDDRQLAARAEARVHAQRHLAADGRLHEQLLHVLAKDTDRALVRAVGQLISDLALQRRPDQAAPRVLRRLAHDLAAGAGRIDHRAADRLVRQRVVHLDAHLQPFLALAAVERQNAVIGRAHHRLAVVRVLRVDVFALLGLHAAQHAAALHQRAQARADGRVVADLLGDDVLRQLDSRLRVRHALFPVDVRRRQLHRIVAPPLRHDRFGQRLHALLPRDHRARAALGLKRPVDVLQAGQRLRPGQLRAELVRQPALLVNRALDLLAALVKAPQIVKPLAQLAQLLIVHRAGLLLAVARDERHSVALVQQRHNPLRDGCADFKLLRQA